MIRRRKRARAHSDRDSGVGKPLRWRLARFGMLLGGAYLLVSFVVERSAMLPGVAESATGVSVPTDANPALGVGPPGRVVSGVLHVHTEHSHDAIGTVAEAAAAARLHGLQFVFVSDHQEDPRHRIESPRWEGDVLVLFGQERGLDDNNGRILLQGVDTVVFLGPGTDEVEDFAARPGATVFVSHPRGQGRGNNWNPETTGGAHAWEVFNLDDGILKGVANWKGPARIAGLLANSPFGRTGESMLRSFDRQALATATAAYDSIYAKSPITAIGSIDAHPKTRIAGKLVPSYEMSMATLVNHVRVDALPSNPDAAADLVMGSLRAGNLFVSLGETEDAKSFQLGVWRSGTFAGGLGSEITYEPDMEIGARVERTRGGVVFRLVRDGHTAGWFHGPSFRSALSGPGSYRLEAYRYAFALGSFYWNLRLWVFSNPIRVLPSAP